MAHPKSTEIKPIYGCIFPCWFSRMVLNLLIHGTIRCFNTANEKQWHVGASLYTSQQELIVKELIVILLYFNIICTVEVNYTHLYGGNIVPHNGELWHIPSPPHIRRRRAGGVNLVITLGAFTSQQRLQTRISAVPCQELNSYQHAMAFAPAFS